MAAFFGTLSDIYTNISGPAVIVMAFATYTKWGNKLLQDRRWISLMIIIIMAFLVCADIYVHHPGLLGNRLTGNYNE